MKQLCSSCIAPEHLQETQSESPNSPGPGSAVWVVFIQLPRSDRKTQKTRDHLTRWKSQKESQDAQEGTIDQVDSSLQGTFLFSVIVVTGLRIQETELKDIFLPL